MFIPTLDRLTRSFRRAARPAAGPRKAPLTRCVRCRRLVPRDSADVVETVRTLESVPPFAVIATSVRRACRGRCKTAG